MWNTAAVTTMKLMFRDGSAFNQDLRKWNVKAVNHCEYMMRGTAKQAKGPKFHNTCSPS